MEHQDDPARAGAVGPPRPAAARFERRFWQALAVALAVHAGAAVVIRFQKAPQPPEASRKPLDVLEVSLLDAPTVAPEENRRHAEAEKPATTEPGAIARAVPTTRTDGIAEPTRTSEDANAPTGAPVLAPSAGSVTPAPEAPRAGLSLDAIGLGSTNPFLGMKSSGADVGVLAPPPPPSAEEPNRTRVAERRLNHSLITGMLEHDRAVGASRGGAVSMVLRDAAMLISSPVTGQAEFVATIDAAGLVTALSPTRVSSDIAAWRNVAAQAMKQLAKKRLRVPTGAAGLEVRLALSSKLQLPSGKTSGPSMHQIPLMSADGTRLSRLELPPENAKLPDQSDPGALGTPLLQQPIPGAGLDGDLADIGGMRRRVVYVTIIEERPL